MFPVRPHAVFMVVLRVVIGLKSLRNWCFVFDIDLLR